jgi:amino acid adenylation domain-containing protein
LAEGKFVATRVSSPAFVEAIGACFRERAAVSPHVIAVASGDETITYRQLHERVERLAFLLMRRGVGPGIRVGLRVHRGIDMVVAVHAVVGAGGAYVPFDPRYPADRTAFMLDDSQVQLVIGHADLLEQLPTTDVELLVLADAEAQAASEAPGESPMRAKMLMAPHPDDLAYVLYTSGSTGRPKGVAVTHRSLRHLVNWAAEEFKAEDLAMVAAAASLNFDISVFELFAPLASGGAIRVVDDAISMSLAVYRHQSDLTMLVTVPSAVAELVHMHRLPAGLRVIITVGEVLTRGLADAIIRERPAVRLFNAYGPTEATVFVTGSDVVAGGNEPPSIGRTFPHVQLYVVDEQQRQVPQGEWGELLIAGEWLAAGYHNRSELTAERFLPDDIDPQPTESSFGPRMYRTGDLVRLRSDGEYDFSGRLDQQIKVRGHRVEIGEIESALTALGGVRAAAVVPQSSDGIVTALVAVLVAGDPGLDTRRVRQQLGATLPEYMVPSKFQVLDELPYLPNGKLNRGALAADISIDPPATRELGRRAESGEEALVAGLMAGVLEIDEVGAEEDFFLDLGATSLQGIRLLTELHRASGILLPASHLLEASTAAQLAQSLVNDGAMQPQAAVVLQEGHPGHPTLFLLCGWFGQALGYRRMLQHVDLPQVRIIAVSPQPNEMGELLSSVTELRDRCISLIRREQPTGPYWIGGYSMGGMLAHEVVAQLERGGENLLPVLLLDSDARTAGLRAQTLEGLRVLATVLRGPRSQRRELWAGARRRLERRRSGQSYGHSTEQAMKEDVRARTRQAQAGGGALALAGLDKIDEANFGAVAHWHPSRSRAQYVLFWTREWAGYRGRDDLGWPLYVPRANMRRIPFDAGHLTMMLEPDVSRLGPLVRREMLTILEAHLGQMRQEVRA